MATKKPVARRKTTRTKSVAATAIDKHAGALKLFANYGFAGLAFGWLLVYTLPEAQKAFTDTIEKQAATNREDRKAAFLHGEAAIDKIATSIDGLRMTFDGNQTKVRANQGDAIELQKKMVELLEKQTTDRE